MKTLCNNSSKRPHPNIFDFATKELSQDAFICWLVSWAKPKLEEVNSPLYMTGRELLERFLRKCGMHPLGVIKTLDVETQNGRIDVLIRINGDIAIIIEDKTDTKEHSNQLGRYVKYVIDELKKKRENIVTIYFKTGDQSSYKGLKQESKPNPDSKKHIEGFEYKLFSRADMLDLLDFGIGQGVNHPIFLDYLEHLRMVESETMSYESAPLDRWEKGRPWQGFFMALQKNSNSDDPLVRGEWDYIPNQKGGFMGFWWRQACEKDWSAEYLQLENNKLCFKIEPKTNDKKKRKAIARDWADALVESFEDTEYRLKKTTVRGGKTMTVATLDDGKRSKSSYADYRVERDDETLDLQSTIDRLNRISIHHTATLKKYRPKN